MSNALSSKYSRYFSEIAQAHGSRLLSTQAVTCLFAGPERQACEIIASGKTYTTDWQVEQRVLMPHCDCGDFAGGEMCCHLWASLLLAEQMGDLQQAGRRTCKLALPANQESISSNNDPILVEESPRRKRRQTKAIAELTDAASGELQLEYELPTRSQRPRPPALLPLDAAAPAILYVVHLESQPADGQYLLLETWWQQATAASGSRPCRPFLLQSDSVLPTANDQQLFLRLREWQSQQPDVAAEQRASGHVYFIAGQHLAELSELLASVPARWRSTHETPARLHRLSFPLTLPANFTIDMQPLPSSQYQVIAGWETTDGFVPCQETKALFAAGYAILQDNWLPVKINDAYQWAQKCRQGNNIVLNANEAKKWCRLLALETDLPTNKMPAEIRCEKKLGSPVGKIFVQTAKFLHQGQEQLHAELSFQYENQTCSEHDTSRRLSGLQPNTVLTRDLDAEDALRERLRQLGLRWNRKASEEEIGWKLRPSQLEQVVYALVMEGWQVHAQGKTYRRPTTKTPSITSGQDWFELQAEVDFNGQALPLPQLLALTRQGSQSVMLDDGTYGILPREWLEKYTALVEIGESSDQKVRFRQQQAALIQAIIQEQEVNVDDRFHAALAKLDAVTVPQPAVAPPEFRAALRPYQQVGLGWLLTMHRLGLGACLADDMGLGKTVQVLAFLATVMPAAENRSALIVMPKSLIFNWQSEIRRFTPWFKVHWHGGPRRKTTAAAFRRYDIILTTYGTLRQDALKLAKIDFEACILDESQAIKNRDSSTAEAARMINARYRVAMTGTPIENHLRELFSQLDFLNPGLLGKLAGATPAGLGGAGKINDDSLTRLRRGVRPFILRRSKQLVAPDLPPKTEQVLWCEMEEEQRQAYDELKQYYQQQLLGENQDSSAGGSFDLLSALLRLRQAACHLGLIQESWAGRPSAKLSTLREQLAILCEEGHKALVFSQFTSLLKLAATQLQAEGINYCYLDGATSDRGALVEAFQSDPALPVFLISLKAGGTGLNLTAADYVFLLDPWWNPAAEAQAIDRAYRIGQTKPVFAYQLIARDTVEEKVLALQKHKRRLAAAVLQHHDAAPTLSREDLKFLLS